MELHRKETDVRLGHTRRTQVNTLRKASLNHFRVVSVSVCVKPTPPHRLDLGVRGRDGAKVAAWGRRRWNAASRIPCRGFQSHMSHGGKGAACIATRPLRSPRLCVRQKNDGLDDNEQALPHNWDLCSRILLFDGKRANVIQFNCPAGNCTTLIFSILLGA